MLSKAVKLYFRVLQIRYILSNLHKNGITLPNLEIVTMLEIIHDSDLHYGWSGLEPREIKKSHPGRIVKSSASIVIVTGDLTDDGRNGAKINLGLTKFRYGGRRNQLKSLMTNYVTPIEESGKKVYLCSGNHDKGKQILKVFRNQPVRRAIRQRHGANTYAVEHEGLRFLIMGKYPKELIWLSNQLREHSDSPHIIAFHYNLQGKYSDWWPDAVKDRFYKIIKDYRIVAILVGHTHISDVSVWQGIQVITSSNKFSRIYYDTVNQKITDVSFARL